MIVAEVMRTEIASIVASPDTPLSEAVEQLSLQNASCLLVTAQDRPIGILTERDITTVFAKYLEGQLSSDAVIESFMTLAPVCVTANLSCEDALALSRSRKLRHLPVINETDQLIGLVTQANLLDAYTALLAKQEKLESSLEELKLLSLEDPLMGIGNRRAMEVDLTFTQAEAERHSKSYGVGLFDLDCFKKFNDRYGHQAGDEALKAVANAIRNAVRASDRVFRYGGEEILVLMPGVEQEEAMICGERVRKAVEESAIVHEDSANGLLTISGGVASGISAKWENLVESADQALYESKNSGRNKVAYRI